MEKKRYLKFNSWSLERIYEGRKYATSRHDKYSDDPRVLFITDKMPWGTIKKCLWQAEGACSPEELQIVIEEIYRRHVPDTEMFYVHLGDFR